jgi:hypothetical protein
VAFNVLVAVLAVFVLKPMRERAVAEEAGAAPLGVPSGTVAAH